MYYQSTRSDLRSTDTAAILRGMAPDGGLFVLPSFDGLDFDWKTCVTKSELEQAEIILGTMFPGYKDMHAIVTAAYKDKFDDGIIAPLSSVGDDYFLELYHGPTSAFKDVALSILPHLIVNARENEGVEDEIVILTATSGDTGKAALEGFHDVKDTKIIVFYPSEGVSDIQKAQMTTQEGGNVYVCGVVGNFDDCQRGVKETFASLGSSEELASKHVRLSSANSINIGRLVPQIVYYFTSYSALLASGRIEFGDPVDFVVPTGNFGDIFAGYYAKMLGLPVWRLVCASNKNKILTDFINTGVYDTRRTFHKTSSPSMDILVSSNLERLLFHASGNDTEFVRDCMKNLSENKSYTVPEKVMDVIRASFVAGFTPEEEVLQTIGELWNKYGYLCDTHTAVAASVAKKYKKESGTENPVVILSTASPFKFSSTVLGAVGGEPVGDEFEQMEDLSRTTGVAIPKNLAALKDRKPLHTEVVGRDGITDFVLNSIG